MTRATGNLPNRGEYEKDWFEKNQSYLFEWINIVKLRLQKIVAASVDSEGDKEGFLSSGNAATESIPDLQEPLWEYRSAVTTNDKNDKRAVVGDNSNKSNGNSHERLSSLDHLAAVLGLSPFEKSILVLCAGAEIDPEISQMCASMYGNKNNVSSNNNIPFPTFDIAIRLFPNAHWSAFLPSSPLRFFQLISLPPGSSGSGRAPILTMPIRIDESILHYILGFTQDLTRLQDNTLTPVVFDTLLPDSQKELVNRIQSAITRLRYRDRDEAADEVIDERGSNNNGNTSSNNNSDSFHACPSPQQPVLINICGEYTSDALLVAKHVCDALALGLLEQSANLIPDNLTDMRSKLSLCVRECRLIHSALIISWKDDDRNNIDNNENAAHQSKLQLIVQCLDLIAGQNQDDNDVVVFLSTRERIPSLDNSALSFNIPRATKDERRKLLREYLASKLAASGLSDEILNLSELELDSLTIQKISKEILLSVESADTKDGSTKADVKKQQDSNATRQQRQKQHNQPQQPQARLPYRRFYSSTILDLNKQLVQNKLSQLAQLVIPKASMDDLVLPDRQKRLIKSIMTHVKQRNKVYHEWGFEQKSARGLGIIALFAGESGTGKTMAAEVLANELMREIYRIDLSTVINKYIGETEKNLKRIFDAAEGSGAILFFDEADALFGKRSEVKDSHDRYANMEVGYLLQRIESYGGLVILATNFKTSLDSAFARRIRFILDFPFPDSKSRTQIWKNVFPKLTPTDGLDYEKLARLSITGGHIRNIAMNAAFIAAGNGEPVNMQSIKQAAEDEYHKMGRSLSHSEIGDDW